MKKIATLCVFFLVLLAGCAYAPATGQAPDQVTEQEGQPYQPSVSVDTVDVQKAMLADSLDTAVILQIDETEHRIMFWNLARGLNYALGYDSATGIKDRFDNELVASQLRPGDVVKVSFLKDEKKAKNIWIDKAVTVMEDVKQFSIHSLSQTMEIEDKRFALDPCVSVLGTERQIDLMDVNEADTLTVYALDHTVLSMVIATGHGYVRLEGADSFEGGFVEFGQSNIYQVEAGALYVLPVGGYDMLISHKGNSGTKQVEVAAGQETTVDVSDLVADAEGQEGGIVFTVTPADAMLLIDGKETDFSDVVHLGVGIHQMKLKKEGYKTITQYIKVGTQLANIDIEMEAVSPGEEDAQEQEESVSGNTINAADGEYKVYIDAPVGAELYVDGTYIGILPATFKKTRGKHTISLRRSGYVTRSYSLDIDASPKDVHYTFSQLQEDMTTTILDYATGLGL